MALDPHFIALHCGHRDLQRAIEVAAQRGWSLIRPTKRALIIISAHAPRGRFGYFGNFDNAADAYSTLAARGMVAVAGNSVGSRIKLLGGSVTHCSLTKIAGKWKVLKRVSKSAMTAVDAMDRHLAEGEWLASIHRSGVRIFPNATTRHHGDFAEIETDFVPAYTLGEHLMRGSISLASGREFVKRLFSRLEKDLYLERVGGDTESYSDKILRRYELMSSQAPTGTPFEILFDNAVQIDGFLCRSVSEQLRTIASSRACMKALTPLSSRLCHGDLIPEDILVVRPPADFVLIDPNPLNLDPMVDLAKFAMSCFTAYDIAIRDYVSCHFDERGRLPRLWLNVPGQWTKFRRDQRDFGNWVCVHARRLVSNLILQDERVEPRAIMLLAGLQALAIPAFHALHHNKPQRAMYFFGAGQYLVESALQLYGI